LHERRAGIEMLTGSIGSLFGNVETDGDAAAASVRFQVVSVGVLCLVETAVLAVVSQTFLKYDS
jgi:hypothetical protein